MKKKVLMNKKLLVGLIVAGILICGALVFLFLPKPAPEGCYVGVYIPSAPYSMEGLIQFEDSIGHKVGIVMWFMGSTDSFPPDACEEVINHGAIPLITWQPFLRGGENGDLLDYIAAGGWDSYLREWAQAARAFGKSVLIRWGHEFNGYWYDWSVPANDNDPNKFIQAWRHVHDIFTDEGATNVKWVWCPYHLSNPDEPWNDPLLAYPGDEYVDWVGLDGYNFGTSQGWSEWLPFRSIYASLIRIYSTRYPDKPIMIAEFASSEEGGDKDAWIRELLPALVDMPQIKAIVWFNTEKETDWRVESSPESLEAFREIMENDYFIEGSPGLWDLPERYTAPENVWPTTSVIESMPFYVYSDYMETTNHFYPTGWMGDYSDIDMNEQWTENTHSGSTCIKVVYSAESQQKFWAGVYWQNPPNNWGVVDGGFNLSNATKLSFWARGENGGERVQFKMGGIAGQHPDSAVMSAGTLTLSDNWEKYEIDLTGRDLSYISGGFVWVAKGEAGYNPEGCTFYLDDIVYE